VIADGRIISLFMKPNIKEDLIKPIGEAFLPLSAHTEI